MSAGFFLWGEFIVTTLASLVECWLKPMFILQLMWLRILVMQFDIKASLSIDILSWKTTKQTRKIFKEECCFIRKSFLKGFLAEAHGKFKQLICHIYMYIKTLNCFQEMTTEYNKNKNSSKYFVQKINIYGEEKIKFWSLQVISETNKQMLSYGTQP